MYIIWESIRTVEEQDALDSITNCIDTGMSRFDRADKLTRDFNRFIEPGDDWEYGVLSMDGSSHDAH